MFQRYVCFFIALLAISLSIPHAWTEDIAIDESDIVADDFTQVDEYTDTEEAEWEFTFLPIFWVMGTHADVTIAGNDFKTNITIGDVFEALDNVVFDEVWGVSGRIEARKGDWWIQFQGSFLEFDEDFGGGFVNVTVEFELTLAQVAVGADILHIPFGDEDGPVLAAGPLAGARYYYFDLDIDANNVNLDRNRDFVDPFVGVRFDLALLPSVTLSAQGTIGGFHVGSDLSWSFATSIFFQPTRHILFAGGFAYLDIDYDDGDDIAFDGQLLGPFMGLGFRF